MAPRSKPPLWFIFLAGSVALLAMACGKGAASGNGALTAHQKRGQKLFIANCQKCHQPDNGLATQGPDLSGVFNKKFLPSGAPANDERAHNVIVNGRLTMPAFGQVLDDEQIDAIIAYLHAQ